ncbi:GNAT family N-acetyltransferase [Glutamicibacter sp.]|uniref:GNAT family N-acetyltransferase n=1 Tax=Glutamicibacter sp. TaxID=1931995 RepID=UPI0028BE557E|nr:GNAT family N-acetyltransferase [Glutamicibacter sp.]
MINDYWPLAKLRLHTERLALRVPTEAELFAVAQVAAGGVSRPGEQPFLTPWTELPPMQRARHVIQQHWARRGAWTVDHWALELAVYRQEQPMGMVALKGRDFSSLREVKTESWLGLEFQRHGYGTEARRALLKLAFGALDAQYALTEVFQDNFASQSVSAKLGYRKDGISRDILHGEPIISDRLRLSARQFAAVDSSDVEISGLEQCLSFFITDRAGTGRCN